MGSGCSARPGFGRILQLSEEDRGQLAMTGVGRKGAVEALIYIFSTPS